MMLWVGICVGAGYLFGQTRLVKENFSLVALGIIVVSMIPLAVGYLRNRKRGNTL